MSKRTWDCGLVNLVVKDDGSIDIDVDDSYYSFFMTADEARELEELILGRDES